MRIKIMMESNNSKLLATKMMEMMAMAKKWRKRRMIIRVKRVIKSMTCHSVTSTINNNSNSKEFNNNIISSIMKRKMMRRKSIKNKMMGKKTTMTRMMMMMMMIRRLGR